MITNKRKSYAANLSRALKQCQSGQKAALPKNVQVPHDATTDYLDYIAELQEYGIKIEPGDLERREGPFRNVVRLGVNDPEILASVRKLDEITKINRSTNL